LHGIVARFSAETGRTPSVQSAAKTKKRNEIVVISALQSIVARYSAETGHAPSVLSEIEAKNGNEIVVILALQRSV
jgi:hypothetical protein